MFFFFAGAIETQLARVIKERAGRCGSDADLVEWERVLKLFFVPVLRWLEKNGAAAYRCRRCSFIFPESLNCSTGGRSRRDLLPEAEDHRAAIGRCAACDRELRPEFRFCPFCGTSL